jgi:hypothetical protein
MCCIKPQQDYENMIHEGYVKGIPYVIWPKEVIDIIIHEIRERKNSKLIIEFNDGKIKYELKQ